MRLENKVAIVTGGASGIGLAIAKGFAVEGARIVIADIAIDRANQAADEIKADGGEAIAVKTDVSVRNEVTAMVEETCKAFGRVDILVNNAGILEEVSIIDSTIEQWDRTMNVNLKGAFFCTQACARVMVEHGKGKIINISSLAEIRGRAKQTAYCASKGGLIAFSGNVANQLGPKGIYCNNIVAGFIDTDFPESLKGTGLYRDYRIKATPCRRLGKPEDLVGPAIFLASDDSDFVNGAELRVDGGASRFLSGIDFVDSEY